jgi:hypothetical protein
MKASLPKRAIFNKTSIFIMLSLGVLLVIVSAFYVSSFLAILGTATLFWGVILLHITPVKHVPLAFLDASINGNANNIERILSEFDLSEKGIYLPPENLKNVESSVIFIPKVAENSLPLAEESIDKFYSKQKDGAFLTPPGLGLSQLFEKEIGTSFTTLDFKDLPSVLPKILIERMEIAENVEIHAQENTITIEITGSLLNGVCQATNNQPRTHAQVGCLLTSALACVLAKATGKPITLQNENTNQETKTTHIEYQILEGETMQSPGLNISDAPLDNGEVKSSISGDSDLNILEIEIAPDSLNYLKKNGNVIILTSAENPQDSSYKIKGFDDDSNFTIKFVEFVEICKTYPGSQLEYKTKIFDVTSPAITKRYDLAFYIAKSGFSKVEDWIKTINNEGIPECSTGHNKIFYLYHIQRRATN